MNVIALRIYEYVITVTHCFKHPMTSVRIATPCTMSRAWSGERLSSKSSEMLSSALQCLAVQFNSIQQTQTMLSSAL